jgi:hypothetical protein
MAYYQNLGVSSGEIGGAIAAGIIHDIRINGLGIQGFPKITVSKSSTKMFKISLHFASSKADFEITEAEAKVAVAQMKNNGLYEPSIFDRIQEAASIIESNQINTIQN